MVWERSRISDRLVNSRRMHLCPWLTTKIKVNAALCTHLRDRAVVPDVPMVGKAVVHKPRLALLLILDDRVERQTLADLIGQRS